MAIVALLFLVANFIMTTEINVNSFIQRDDLDSYVEVNWYLPLIIIDLICIISFIFGVIVKPTVMGDIIAIILLAIQGFFWMNYRKTMLIYIQKCWFTKSLTIATVISYISSAVVLLLLVCEIISSEF